MQEEKTKNEQAKDNIVLSDVMRSLILKYKEEWKKANRLSVKETFRGYKKPNMREIGKKEAFVMIIDDLVSALGNDA